MIKIHIKTEVQRSSMDAKKIEILLEAMESGSLMAAAEKNGYTPSGLSHLLHRLEEELGVKLAKRNNRGIALSDEGVRLLPYLRKCVNAYKDLEREAGKLGQKNAEILHIAAYASIAKNWMPELIGLFSQNHPEITVELEVVGRQELYRSMKNGKYNLIFACEDKSYGYNFIPLAEDRFFAVLPQSFEGNGSFPLKDFENYPFIMPSYGEDVEVHELFAKYGITPKLLPATADDPVIIGMVAGGMGVSMMSELVLQGSGENVKKLSVEPAAFRELGVVYKERKLLSKAEKSFLDFVRDYFRQKAHNSLIPDA